MRKHLELSLVLVLVAVVVSWVTPDSVGSEPTPASVGNVRTPVDRLAVRGCWLGMTERELVALHGQPSRVHSRYKEYVQWDYHSEGLNIVLGPGHKIVTVEGDKLTRNEQTICVPGTPLEQVEASLGPCRTPLGNLPNYQSASFSTDKQAVHVAHKNLEAGRISLTVDYSVQQ